MVLVSGVGRFFFFFFRLMFSKLIFGFWVLGFWVWAMGLGLWDWGLGFGIGVEGGVEVCWSGFGIYW